MSTEIATLSDGPESLVSILSRMESKYSPEPNTGCWLWMASSNPNGYGQLWDDRVRKVRLAHVISYEFVFGDVPRGLELDHKCRVPACINPVHLEPVTHAENVRRGTCGIVNALRHVSKTHCASGHPFSAENTRRDKRQRVCKTCKRIRQVEYSARKRAANV